MVLFGIIIQKKLLSIRRNFRKHDEQLKLLFNESIDDVHMWYKPNKEANVKPFEFQMIRRAIARCWEGIRR